MACSLSLAPPIASLSAGGAGARPDHPISGHSEKDAGCYRQHPVRDASNLLQALERCPCGRLAAENRASTADVATFEKRLLPVDREDGNGLATLIIGSLMTLLLTVRLRGPVFYSNRSKPDRDARDVHRSDCRRKKQESARMSKIVAG